MSAQLLIHGHLVVDECREYLDGALLIEDGFIKEVYPHSNKLPEMAEVEIVDLQGSYILPGFVDTHTHGCGGINCNALEFEQLDKLAYAYGKNGTTSFFATLTNHGKLFETLALHYCHESRYARFLGWHLEGPFLNKNKRGCIKAENLLLPDLNYLNDLLNIAPNTKQMTLAPELSGAKEIAGHLKEKGVRVMLGHSAALEEELTDFPYDGFTHLYNAMSGFSHRDLGLVNAAFDRRDKYCELICDGVHSDKKVLAFTLRNLNRDKVIAVSDSTLAAGCPDGDFLFEERLCIKDHGRFFRIDDGVLAGSCTTLAQEAKVLFDLGIKPMDIAAYTSLNALRFYGLDKQLGSLIKGHYADFVQLDEQFRLQKTYLKGEVLNV